MIGNKVMIKFGTHHGRTGTVLNVTEKNGEPAVKIEVNIDSFTTDIITKRQKNTIKMLPVNN